MKKWDIDIDGIKHEIIFKYLPIQKIIIDGKTYKVKPPSIFIDVIDYDISFDNSNTDCKLVAIANKADLAVNGIFIGSKKKYEPLKNIPTWIWVLVGISILSGFLFSGILSLAIGISMRRFYIKYAAEKKNRHVIALFIGCTIIQISIGLVAFLYLIS